MTAAVLDPEIVAPERLLAVLDFAGVAVFAATGALAARLRTSPL